MPGPPGRDSPGAGGIDVHNRHAAPVTRAASARQTSLRVDVPIRGCPAPASDDMSTAPPSGSSMRRCGAGTVGGVVVPTVGVTRRGRDQPSYTVHSARRPAKSRTAIAATRADRVGACPDVGSREEDFYSSSEEFAVLGQTPIAVRGPIDLAGGKEPRSWPNCGLCGGREHREMIAAVAERPPRSAAKSLQNVRPADPQRAGARRGGSPRSWDGGRRLPVDVADQRSTPGGSPIGAVDGGHTGTDGRVASETLREALGMWRGPPLGFEAAAFAVRKRAVDEPG